MENKILLATRNRGKIAELDRLMAAFGLEVLGLDAFPELEEVEETGRTFEENALLKARHAAARTGLVSLADDSGLEAKALGGAPGVFSARFHLEAPEEFFKAQPRQDKDFLNVAWLLEKMKPFPQGERQARFCSVIAAVRPDGASIAAAGCWPGELTFEQRGENGFGYDPVFFDPARQRTAAQMSLEEKNRHSHRARALRQLAGFWPGFWAGF
ncbi:MAG: RdgB/HAM1 family non-canonical purine NTP pyrophosphatase [Deltaproteobacteria bacterium]|jgi:XTP/dITP diphosphohydrolase|nr:RdgB/HAM1 family non-canonical purine NTP pyrophosphatase [Deltaproteobacteria bacterium]